MSHPQKPQLQQNRYLRRHRCCDGDQPRLLPCGIYLFFRMRLAPVVSPLLSCS
jgi:hypothetical protein